MLSPGCETAPFCADPQRHAWLQALVERSTDFLLHQVGPQNIDAIILTGSTARGEASVLPTGADYRLLGDLEFLVIVRAPFDWPAMRRRMHELSCRATRDIGAEGYHASIEYGPAGRVYLQRNIRPSIFAYDLRTHGRIIWQQVDIWPDIRPVSVEEIPREDALNLLMNRLVELLMLDARRCRADLRAVQDQAYHLVKVMLDLAGSALAFAGRYVSRYSDRSRDFRDLLDASPDLWAALRDVDHFVATLEQAVACKLDPTDTCLALPDPTAAMRQHTVWGLGLWLWEAQHLLGLPATTFRHTLEAYLARETLGARLKGWGKFLCHPLRPAHALSWPRVLRHLFRTSPQTLTYAAALLVQAGMAGETGPDWRQQVAVVSPVPLSAAHSGQVAQDIGALWQWLLRNN